MNTYRFFLVIFIVVMLALSGCKKSDVLKPSMDINNSDVIQSPTYPHGTDKMSSNKNPEVTVKPGITIKSDSADVMAGEMMP